MRPIREAARLANWLGSVAAIITFVAVYFAEDFESLRWQRQGMILIVCGPDFLMERAGRWSFVAFAGVFTPTLLIGAGRVRENAFRRNSGISARSQSGVRTA